MFYLINEIQIQRDHSRKICKSISEIVLYYYRVEKVFIKMYAFVNYIFLSML